MTPLGDVYEKTGASTWTKRANVQGPAGPVGPAGATGAAEAWFSGSGVPGSGLGVDGDWYLDTTGAWPTPYAPPPLVAALPASPADGQECYYLADATNGVVWHLRYRSAASGSYKWEYVGGPPLWAVETSGASFGAGGIGAWTVMTPNVTVPLAGTYDVSWGGQGSNTVNGAYIGLGLVVSPATAPTGDAGTSCAPPGAGLGLEIPERTLRLTVTAGIVLKFASAVLAGSGTGVSSHRRMLVRPVRVG